MNYLLTTSMQLVHAFVIIAATNENLATFRACYSQLTVKILLSAWLRLRTQIEDAKTKLNASKMSIYVK